MVKLNQTFVTPFDREDIYRLASALDDVIDAMEEAADLIVLYRLDDAARGHRRAGRGAAAGRRRCTAEAMPRLERMDDLESTGSRSTRLENEADAIYRTLLGDLLARRTTRRPPTC